MKLGTEQDRHWNYKVVCAVYEDWVCMDEADALNFLYMWKAGHSLSFLGVQVAATAYLDISMLPSD